MVGRQLGASKYLVIYVLGYQSLQFILHNEIHQSKTLSLNSLTSFIKRFIIMFQNNNVFDTPIKQTPSFDDKFGQPKQTSGDLSSGPVKSVRVISVNFLEMVEHQQIGFRPYISKGN